MNTIRVLILKEAGMVVDIEDDLKAWTSYELSHTGISLQFEERTVALAPLKHESFKIVSTPGGSVDMYGLSGIKEQIRPLVAQGLYDAVIFVYDIEDSELYKSNPSFALAHIGNWTYFDPLYPGMPFTEVVVDKDWAANDPFRVFSHEIRHNFCYRLRALGYAVQDQMDMSYVLQPDGSYKWVPYFKEYDPLATDGNRAIQNTLLSPFLSILFTHPEVHTFIQQLQAQVAALLSKITMTTTKDTPGLLAWAAAAKVREGWAIGTTSYRNLNPGNLRYTPYTKSLGAIGHDPQNFCIFPTYAAGENALLQFFRDARANELIPYREYAQKHGRKMPTLQDFYQVYAPAADSNDPNSYAVFVAKQIGCTIDTPINQI